MPKKRTKKQITTITYKGKKYRTRTFDVKFEGLNHTYTVAHEDLFKAFGEDYDKWGTPEHALDNQIYFYLEDKIMKLSAKKIVEEHLDEPMGLIGERF